MNDSSTGNQYLESTVRSASPARLRLMLLERSIDTAAKLAASWRDHQATGANEHSLRLLDLLTELLSGVSGGTTADEQQICNRVADLYVFLTQHLVAAEPISDAQSVDEIKLILETEADTWRAVCAQETGQGPIATSRAPAGGLNLQG